MNWLAVGVECGALAIVGLLQDLQTLQGPGSGPLPQKYCPNIGHLLPNIDNILTNIVNV